MCISNSGQLNSWTWYRRVRVTKTHFHFDCFGLSFHGGWNLLGKTILAECQCHEHWKQHQWKWSRVDLIGIVHWQWSHAATRTFVIFVALVLDSSSFFLFLCRNILTSMAIKHKKCTFNLLQCCRSKLGYKMTSFPIAFPPTIQASRYKPAPLQFPRPTTFFSTSIRIKYKFSVSVKNENVD